MVDALAHPYLDEGRLRYHSCMCKCCFTTSGGMRQYTSDFEPVAPQAFDDQWERRLNTVQQVKGAVNISKLRLLKIKYIFVLLLKITLFKICTNVKLKVLIFI